MVTVRSASVSHAGRVALERLPNSHFQPWGKTLLCGLFPVPGIRRKRGVACFLAALEQASHERDHAEDWVLTLISPRQHLQFSLHTPVVCLPFSLLHGIKSIKETEVTCLEALSKGNVVKMS